MFRLVTLTLKTLMQEPIQLERICKETFKLEPTVLTMERLPGFHNDRRM